MYKPGAVPPSDVAAYVAAYARPGRMDAAFDYCRNIVVDMEFNKKHFTGKMSTGLLAVGGQYSIPTMGEALQPRFENVTSVVIPEAGHFVPEEQPEALAKALIPFLEATAWLPSLSACQDPSHSVAFHHGKENIVPTLLNQALPETLKCVQTRPLFILRERVPPLFVVGQTPNGFRRIGVVPGGTFEGERLSCEVVSGNDWQSVRADSCIKLDARLLLKTTDGALIVMTYTCLCAGPPNIIEKLDKGEGVDPGSCYFRMSRIFETSAPQYDWINRIIAVGVGHRLSDGPLYSIFEVL